MKLVSERDRKIVLCLSGDDGTRKVRGFFFIEKLVPFCGNGSILNRVGEIDELCLVFFLFFLFWVGKRCV